jgi:hypothetical protein
LRRKSRKNIKRSLKNAFTFSENIKRKYTKRLGFSGKVQNKKSRCKKHLPFVAGPGIDPGTS